MNTPKKTDPGAQASPVGAEWRSPMGRGRDLPAVEPRSRTRTGQQARSHKSRMWEAETELIETIEEAVREQYAGHGERFIQARIAHYLGDDTDGEASPAWALWAQSAEDDESTAKRAERR